MGRRAISVAQKVEFFALLDQGYSVTNAAKGVGICLDTAYRWKKVGPEAVMQLGLTQGFQPAPRNGQESRAKRIDASMAEPLKPQLLCTEARRALEDFDYFRLRYLGRRATPWQANAAARAVDYYGSDADEYLVVNCPPGSGKALDVTTPILTVGHGWTTMGELRVGERIYDDQGMATTVIAKSEVFTDHDCYRVEADDGASVIADADHLWPVRLHGYGQYHGGAKPDRPGKTGPKPSPDGVQIHTTEFLAKPRSKQPQLRMGGAFLAGKVPRLIDPYVLGVWLGDGSAASPRIAADPEDAKHLRAEIEAAGYTTRDLSRDTSFSVSTGTRSHKRSFTSLLGRLGVLNNKHVPEEYLLGSTQQRLALLQGLIDTDGHVAPSGHVEFCNTNRQLAESVQFLVHSLGRKASLREGRATLNGRDCGPKYRVMFYMDGCARLPRKASLTRDGERTPHRYLAITKVDTVPTQCIQVDSPSRCYLAGRGLMVTHNSTVFPNDFLLWLICRDRSIRILIGSSTQKLAEKYSNRLRRTLERTKPLGANPAQGRVVAAEAALAQDFGRFRPLASGGDIWTRAEFTVAQLDGDAAEDKEPTVSAYGMDSEFLGHRANVVVWDDLVTRRILRNAEQVENQREWWASDGETRLEPGGLLLLQGQRMGADDLYRHCLDMELPEELDLGRDRKYHHVIYPAHFEDLCTGEHGKDAQAWPDGCLLDPVRLPWSKLATVQRNRTEAYRVQYQQEDVDPSSVLVPMMWIKGGLDPETREQLPGCWDERREIGTIPEGLEAPLLSICTADPSPTKFWSIQWWIVQPHTNQRFLIDLVKQSMDAPDFLDWNANSREFFGLCEDWQTRSVDLGFPITHWIVENNAAQRFLLQYDHVRRWQSKHSVQIIAHSTHRNKTDPDFGVQMLKNLYRFGQVRLPGGALTRFTAMKLVDEVTRYPDTQTDDCMMAQWFMEYQVIQGGLIRSLDHEPAIMRRPSWMRKKTRVAA